MSYLRGDYYGDYYGDPGIFSSIGRFLGGVAKTAISIASPVLGGVIKVAGGGEKFSTPFSPYVPPGGGTMPGVTGAAIVPAAPPPGSFGPVMPGGGVMMTSPMGTPLSPTGQAVLAARMRHAHLNKQTYMIRGGGTSRWGPHMAQPQVIPKGTVPVPNRRMNVANPRALRRSLRRVAGFAKLTKRVRRAVSMAASAVGVRRGARKAIRRR